MFNYCHYLEAILKFIFRALFDKCCKQAKFDDSEATSESYSTDRSDSSTCSADSNNKLSSNYSSLYVLCTDVIEYFNQDIINNNKVKLNSFFFFQKH